MRTARVVIDIPVRGIDRPFDYLVPERLDAAVDIGVAVVVPFGGRDLVGWVVDLPEQAAVSDPSPITEVLTEALFDAVSAKLALWIAEEYVSPLSDAVRLLLPPGFNSRLTRGGDGDDGAWSLQPARASAVDERWVTRTSEPFTPGPRAVVQRALLDLVESGPLSLHEITATLGSGARGAVDALVRKGAVVVEERRRYRTPAFKEKAAGIPSALTRGQRDALDAIGNERAVEVPVLVDGVTGSGKTEVYLQAIEAVLATGATAIVLVPEISLTPQTVGRFRTRFGERVAVLHSRLSVGERFDEWDRIRSGEARVVVGARSALFAPVRDLALVVIDEEHESSYKQGSSPRYHARDVARRLCALRGAKLVLGSATPSLESIRSASEGLYDRIVMDQRVAGGAMPAVTVVDMAGEFAAGHRSMFSRPLTQALFDVAERGQKAVLLLNRRGFASFLLCRECGHVPRCDSCSTSMTYHETGPVLACHHCGARRKVPSACPECQSVYLRKFGAGTQRVHAELQALLPQLPVIRMDADTTTGKGGHERCLVEFESHDSAVLLGTQMVAKGLDYPEVTLVGVLNADTTLQLPDFRSAERTHQLLAQVSGRAGRGPAGGSVIVQTYWPHHPAIEAVRLHDPSVFHAQELRLREELRYPPFSRLANIIVSGDELSRVRQTALQVAEALRTSASEGYLVVGPSPAPLQRIKRAYRWHVLVKGAPGAAVPGLLRDTLGGLRLAGVTLAVDVDPVDLL